MSITKRRGIKNKQKAKRKKNRAALAKKGLKIEDFYSGGFYIADKKK